MILPLFNLSFADHGGAFFLPKIKALCYNPNNKAFFKNRISTIKGGFMIDILIETTCFLLIIFLVNLSATFFMLGWKLFKNRNVLDMIRDAKNMYENTDTGLEEMPTCLRELIEPGMAITKQGQIIPRCKMSRYAIERLLE